MRRRGRISDMDEALNDEEFKRLARILLVQHVVSVPGLSRALPPIDEKLIESNLLKLKQTRISSGVEVTHLSLTHWGYHVLTQDNLRLILCLIDLNAAQQAASYIPYLTQEELPILLTHSNQYIRAEAAERMKFCLTPGEELWETFIKNRGPAA